MTRVAGIPEELQALAAALVGSAPELELAAAMLASAEGALPSMPGGVAAEVAARISQAQKLVTGAAETAQAEGRDLARRGLWLRIFDRINEGWEPTAAGFGLVATPNDAIDAVENWRAVRLLHVWQAYQEAVSPAVAAETESSLAALNAQLRFQEENPMAPARFATVLEGAGEESAYLESLGPLATMSETVGKFTPFGGLVAGVVEVWRPQHSSGALMVVDRGAGFASAAGSGALLLSEAGLVALAPEAVPVIIVVVAAAGLWELWENKQEIARLAVAGGKFVANHPYVLAGPPGIAAHEAWRYRKPIAQALVSAADTGKNLAEDGATTILHGAASVLGHVTPHIHVGALSIP